MVSLTFGQAALVWTQKIVECYRMYRLPLGRGFKKRSYHIRESSSTLYLWFFKAKGIWFLFSQLIYVTVYLQTPFRDVHREYQNTLFVRYPRFWILIVSSIETSFHLLLLVYQSLTISNLIQLMVTIQGNTFSSTDHHIKKKIMQQKDPRSVLIIMTERVQ